MNVFNYNHLFYFYVVSKLSGVTVAAKHLNTSQSSLSTQLKILEGVIGKPLFKKSGRKLELTDFGKDLFNYCRRSFEVFDEMFDHINSKKSSMGIRLSVGVSVGIEKSFVTDALAKVSTQYSKGRRPLLNLISYPTHQLLQLLRAGELDLILISNAVIDQGMESLGDFDFSVGAYSTKDIASSAKNQTLEAFLKTVDLSFVLPSRATSMRAEIDRYFIRKKISPDCVFESNIISSVIRAATDGMGVALLPEVYLTREIKSQRLVSLSDKALWKHRMTLISSRDGLDEGRKIFAGKLVQLLRNESSMT
ncbi:MAG: LysR family transcriptional regulator [Bdellovibrionales bacterium]